MIRLIISLIVLVGCGSSPSSTQSDPAVTAAATTTATQKDEAPSQQGDESAQLVSTLDDAPDCARDNDLIYVKAEALFYLCDLGLGWKAIDLKGKDGVPGAAGATGAAGKDGADGSKGDPGKDGRDGLDGRDGADGRDAPYVGTTEWLHPITGEKWLLGRRFAYINLVNAASPVTLCPAGAVAPASAEFTDAVLAGLWNKLGSAVASVSNSDSSAFLLKQDGNILTLGRSNDGVVGTFTSTNMNMSLYVYSLCIVE